MQAKHSLPEEGGGPPSDGQNRYSKYVRPLGYAITAVLALVLISVIIALGLKNNSLERRLLSQESTTLPPITLAPETMKKSVSIMGLIGVSLDAYEFDLTLIHGSAGYSELIRLCNSMKGMEDLPTHYPIYSITNGHGTDFLKDLAGQLEQYKEKLIAPDESQTLIWTGAYFDLRSEKPFVLNFANKPTRHSLELLSWCDTARDYKTIINDKIKNIEEFADASLPTTDAKLIHIVLKYSRSGSVCLDLYDENIENNVIQPIAACQKARIPERETNVEEPHVQYFFPRIIDKKVSYAKAKDLCKPLSKTTYSLSGLHQANVIFLNSTANLVADVTRGRGVWIGGHFDLRSTNPFLVRWADGKVSDSKKSPGAIWCQHPSEVISQMLNSDEIKRARDNPKGDALIVPIVRLKSKSHCLTLYTDEVLHSEPVFFQPLCVTNPVQIALKKDCDNVLISPLYERMFNKDQLAFLDMQKRIGTPEAGDPGGRNGLIVKHGSTGDHTVVGFKELMSQTYAEALCSHVHIAGKDSSSPRGSAVGHHMFNDVFQTSGGFPDDINKEFQNLDPLPDKSSLTTSARFDFQPENKDYKQLIYQMNEKKEVRNPSNIIKAWCSEVGDIDKWLNNAYDEFKTWHDDVAGGKHTTGPYYVHMAIEGRKDGKACLKPIVEDLYWPGSHSFFPLCQASKVKP